MNTSRFDLGSEEENTMPQIPLSDPSLKDYDLTPRVSHLKDIYFKAMPEICIERPRLITRFSLENGLFNQKRISILDKARLYRYVLENRAPIVRHSRAYKKGMKPFEFEEAPLFAGSTTSKFKGVILYPEFLALTLWPELWTISKRASNPFHITDSEVKELNFNIFPPWMENTILELARKRCFEENWERFKLKNHAPEIKLLERLVFFIASKPNCISHTIPDFSRAINLGLRGIIDEANDKKDKTSDDSKREFYTAITEVLEGIITYSKNLAAKAEELAEREADPTLKKELLDIAEVNRRVPEFPARTFREGLTTVWICWTAVHLENPNVGLSLGRLDQVLSDLYRQDMENGTIDIQDAIELICCLWLKIGDHVPTIPDAGEQLFGGTGSNQAITIGGVDKDGNDAVNGLTYVMLRATELMKLRDPNPNARYYPGVNSKEYLRRLCAVNINTGAIPAIHNDKAVIKSLTSKGETVEHARDYGVIGCVEPGSNGRFYGHSGAILLNLTSTLELALFNGRHRHTGLDLLISKETGDPTTFTTFEEFKAAFEEQTRWLVEGATNLNNILGRVHQDFYPTPILSALFEGPMEKGKDLIQGGAFINSSGTAIIGLADVADSLSAIQKVVFEERTVSFADLLDALEKNFVCNEALQKRLMNPDKTPKYGNEDPVADANVTGIVELLDGAFGEKVNYRGGRYRVGYWTMTSHAGFGRLMGALPSGRKARENFTSGITPVSGVTPYLTKALNSVAKQPAQCLSSGVALNLKYTPENGDKEQMLDNFVASVEGYFDDADGERDGGMEIQFIIADHNTLAQAVEHPEEFRELLVRVSGYTAFFKDLNPQMQKEIIDRTEYCLSTGKMVPFDPFPLPKRNA
jgi:formate C-acetyltransferase